VIGRIVGTAARTVLVFADIALNAAAGPVKLPPSAVVLDEDRVRALAREEVSAMAVDALADFEPQIEQLGLFDDPVIGEFYRNLYGRN
jgi:hypothetical protein